MNKENVAATPTFTRKRAKSFSTPPSTRPATKSSRGILKGNNGDDAHTIAFIPIHSPSKKRTASAEKRRKSLSRRVSFASHASVRLFEKPGEASPQETPRRSVRLSPAKSPIPRQVQAQASSQDDSNDEITMDLTTMFPQANSLAAQTSPLAAGADVPFDSDSSDSSDDEDETAAMDFTDLVPLPNRLANAAGTPRKSMLPVRARPTAKSPSRELSRTSDDDQTMDMTSVYSAQRPLLDPASPFAGPHENEDGMDLTKIVGGILPSSAYEAAESLAYAIEEDQANQTVNMDETQIFNAHVRDKLVPEDQTSHTSYTVATEEDSTQRLCDGSVTQADGLTHNLNIAQMLPHANIVPPPVTSAGVGFAWGSFPVQTETSLVDVSMADVTDADATMNMDMTQAVRGDLLQSPNKAAILDEANDDMSFTQILPPNTPQSQDTIGSASNEKRNAQSSPRRSPLKRSRLSSGPLRSPSVGQSNSPSSQTMRTPSPKKSHNIAARRDTSPRKSLLESEIPKFGTPEAKIILEPNSVQRPEFSSALLPSGDNGLAMLQEKIQSMTPKKASQEVVPMSIGNRARVMEKISPEKKARFRTPQKSPQRSLLLPYASVSRSAATTPARTANANSATQMTVDDFLKMTGVSFLTNLSTTRRRETLALSKASKPQPDGEVSEVDKLISEAYTLPMLEMYQHSCRELNRYIDEGRAMCADIEADMNEQNPEIFDQYRSAAPAEKRELEAKFKALKTMSRLSAKGVWYVWRTNLIDSVLVPLKKNLADLEKSKDEAEKELELSEPQFEEIRRQYEEVKAQAELLQREEDLYNAYDHAEAARLNKLIEDGERELAAKEMEVQLLTTEEDTAKDELAALEEEYQAALLEVSQLEEENEKNRGYSSAELAEFKQVYSDFVANTGLQVTHVNASTLELTFEDSLHIAISLQDMTMSLQLTDSSKQDTLCVYYLQHVSQALKDFQQNEQKVKPALEFVRNQWSAVTLLIQELRILESVYPISTKINEDDNVQITVPVLLPTSRTKFVVDMVSTPALSREECHLEVSVIVKYGGLDGSRVQEHIQSRLQQQSLAKRASGWLLESLKMPEGL